MTRRTHAGGCHCGAVRFEVDADLDAGAVLDCNCSICRMKGYLHLIVTADAFRLLQGSDALVEYRFGTRIAVHRFCRTCGVHPFYTPRSHPDGVDVNARCLDDVRIAQLTIETFDGADWENHVQSIRTD